MSRYRLHRRRPNKQNKDGRADAASGARLINDHPWMLEHIEEGKEILRRTGHNNSDEGEPDTDEDDKQSDHEIAQIVEDAFEALENARQQVQG